MISAGFDGLEHHFSLFFEDSILSFNLKSCSCQHASGGLKYHRRSHSLFLYFGICATAVWMFVFAIPQGVGEACSCFCCRCFLLGAVGHAGFAVGARNRCLLTCWAAQVQCARHSNKKDQTTNNNTRSTYTDSSPRINLHEPHTLRG